MLAELARAVDEDLSTAYHAPATERAYAHDWDDFVAFCELHGLEPLPATPQTLALYLKALETRRSRSPRAARTPPTGLPNGVRALGLALPTLWRRLAAIRLEAMLERERNGSRFRPRASPSSRKRKKGAPNSLRLRARLA